MDISMMRFTQNREEYSFHMYFDGKGGTLYGKQGNTLAVIDLRDEGWTVGLFADCEYSYDTGGYEYGAIDTWNHGNIPIGNCVSMAAATVTSYLESLSTGEDNG